jgi:hypothetical protein
MLMICCYFVDLVVNFVCLDMEHDKGKRTISATASARRAMAIEQQLKPKCKVAQAEPKAALVREWMSNPWM